MNMYGITETTVHVTYRPISLHDLEVGAGSVLTGLVGAILDGRPHLAVGLDRKGKDGMLAWAQGLARLV